MPFLNSTSFPEVTTIWRYTNVYIIIIIILQCQSNKGVKFELSLACLMSSVS